MNGEGYRGRSIAVWNLLYILDVIGFGLRKMQPGGGGRVDCKRRGVYFKAAKNGRSSIGNSMYCVRNCVKWVYIGPGWCGNSLFIGTDWC